MHQHHRRPWGVTRWAPFSPAGLPARPYHLELDPLTQTGVYRDAATGEIIEAGRHGTNKETSKQTVTSGTDGAEPSKDSDTITDYADD